MNESLHTQLDQVSQALESWRQQKRYKHEKIPDKLWRQILSLAPHLTFSELACHFHLNRGSLTKRLKQARVKPLADPTGSSFPAPSPQKSEPIQSSLQFREVSFPQSSVLPHDCSLFCERVELKRSDGSRLRLYASQEKPFEVKTLIESFLKE